MRYYRLLQKPLKDHFKKFKQAILLLGPRQAGKTTLLKHVFPKALYLLVDEKPVKSALETYSATTYKAFIKDADTVIIDEAHLLSDPGRMAKILYDQLPDLRLILTGSSSLRIKNRTAESMAGRAIDYFLYPLTFGEMLYQLEVEDDANKFILEKIMEAKAALPAFVGRYDLNFWLNQTLKYGSYPEVINLSYDAKEEYLRNLADKAIFKDIVELNLISNRQVARKLLVLLAYQVGNIINYVELSRMVGASIPTVQRYIEIFEQSFILFRVYPFTKNKRKEITKSPKIYFWDVGLRNALLNNFADMQMRGDVGSLFENFIVSEIKKEVAYKYRNFVVNYWRSKQGSEVDVILSEPGTGTIYACEIKYTKEKARFPKTFTNLYPQAKTYLINSSNFWS